MNHKRTRKAIRAAFDAAILKEICERDTDDWSDHGVRWADPKDDSRFYYFKDNGSDILFVSHLDHVASQAPTKIYHTKRGLRVDSPTLDDRLGVYLNLHLFPALLGQGFADILLTTDEEQGASTASIFVPPVGRQYKWIVSADRMGTDVVLYQYDCPIWEAALEASGMVIGQGSFSCIASLERLGASAMNLGVGYKDYHSARSHAYLEDTFVNVANFLRFYATNRDIAFPHTERPLKVWHDWSKYDWSAPRYIKVVDEEYCSACNGVTVGEYCPTCEVDWSSDADISRFLTDWSPPADSWFDTADVINAI